MVVLWPFPDAGSYFGGVLLTGTRLVHRLGGVPDCRSDGGVDHHQVDLCLQLGSSGSQVLFLSFRFAGLCGPGGACNVSVSTAIG